MNDCQKTGNDDQQESSKNSSGSHLISRAIDGVKGKEDSAAYILWKHFSEQMIRIARSKVFAQHRRFYDAEDIVNSAFADIILQLWDGELEGVRTRNDIWRMLSLALRNTHSNTRKHYSRQRRGGGNLRGHRRHRNGTGKNKGGGNKAAGNAHGRRNLSAFETRNDGPWQSRAATSPPKCRRRY